MVIHRSTRQRRLVLDEVQSRYDHPTAQQIFEAVRMRDPHVSCGTVYRNLAHLSATGQILEIEMPDANRYDLTTIPHYHLRCTCCGAVVDAPIDFQEHLNKLTEKGTGFANVSHDILFSGVCPACQAAAHDDAICTTDDVEAN